MTIHETAIVEEDFSTLSIEDKISHKNWKARLQGYEELLKIWKQLEDPLDPELKKYSHIVTICLNDNNAAALDAAYTLILCFLDIASLSIISKLRKELVFLIVEKGLLSSKTTTKSKALECIIQLIYIDHPDPIIDELLSLLHHKNARTIAAVVSCLFELVHQFGIPPIPCKGILKELSLLFSHTDKQIRSETQKLAIECHKWLGSSLILPFLKDLKPIQLKELSEIFDSQLNEPKPIPMKTLKSSAIIPDTLIAHPTTPQPSNSTTSSTDLYSLIDPVTVLDRLPQNLEESLSSSDWKVRKEILDQLLSLIQVPKLATGYYGELVSLLGKRISDTNINIVILSSQCIKALAIGLRESFLVHHSILLPLLLERLKEKKNIVVDALRACIDAIFNTGELIDFTDDAIPFLSHKNPQVKSETLLWLSRCLFQYKKNIPSKQDITPLIDSLMKCIEDGTIEVREASFQLLACLIQIMGAKFMSKYTDKLDKVKLSRVQEYMKHDTISEKPSTNEITKISNDDTKNSKNIKSIPASSVISTKSKPATNKAKVNTTVYSWTDESADQKMQELFISSPNILKELVDSNWKTRLVAMESLVSFLDTISFHDSIQEVIIRYLMRYPGFKESNFQVLTRMLEAIDKTLTKSLPNDTFNIIYSCLSLICNSIVDKLGDVKLKKPCFDLLLHVSELITPQSVISLLYEHVQQSKNPKVLVESIKLFESIIREFGVQTISLKQLLDCLFIISGNPNALIRSSINTLIVVIYQYSDIAMREQIRSIISTKMSSQSISSIESEFSKIHGNPTIPNRSTKTNNQISCNEDNELVQRVDLILTPNVLQGISDPNWKVRKENMDQVIQMIENTHRSILPNNSINTLIHELKGRLVDSNKNMICLALELVSLLAISLGKSLEKTNIKSLFVPIMQTVSDSKIQVRSCAINALNSISNSSSIIFAMILSEIPSLLSTSPLLCKDLIIFVHDRIDIQLLEIFKNPLLVVSISQCLTDRNADVRKVSQQCIQKFANILSNEWIQQCIRESKPNLLSVVNPLISNKTVSDISNKPAINDKMKTINKTNNNDKVSKPSSTITAKSNISNNDAYPIQLNIPNVPSKQIRAEKDKGALKFVFDISNVGAGYCGRKDLVDHLRDNMEPYISHSVHQALFSDDFKDHLLSVSTLDDFLSTPDIQSNICSTILASSDLYFKYVAIRLLDSTNITLIMKCFDLLEHVCKILDLMDYQMMEYEANCIFPYLLPKLGDSKESIRSRVHSILVIITRIFPTTKLVQQYYLEMIKNSKNTRLKTELLEEIALCIERMEGIHMISHPSSKLLSVVANAFITEKDLNVRQSAFKVLATTLTCSNDENMNIPNILKNCGKLNPKDATIIEEKLKKIQGDIKPIEKQQEDQIIVENVEPVIDISHPVIEIKPFSLDLDKLDSNILPDIKLATSSASDEWKLTLDVLLQNISNDDPIISLQGIKLFESRMIKDSDDINMILIQFVGTAITCISTRLDRVLEQTKNANDQSKLDLIQGIGSILMVLCSHKRIIHHSTMDRSTISTLIGVIIKVLCWEQIKTYSFIHENSLSAFRKNINVVLIKILEYGDRDHLYDVLLDALRFDCSKHIINDSDNEMILNIELIMKCLWRLTRSLQDDIQKKAIHIPKLIKELHIFFSDIHPNEWKKRSSEGKALSDNPIKTAKSILHELTVSLNAKELMNFVREGLGGLVVDIEASIVTGYLKYMLDRKNISNEANDTDEKNELNKIFALVMDKETSKDGLMQLYKMKQANPEKIAPLVNIWLDSVGTFFRGYVLKGLADIEQSQSTKNLEYRSKLEKIQEMFHQSSYSYETKKNTNIGIIDENRSIPQNNTANREELTSSIHALKQRLMKIKDPNNQ